MHICMHINIHTYHCIEYRLALSTTLVSYRVSHCEKTAISSCDMPYFPRNYFVKYSKGILLKYIYIEDMLYDEI